MEPRDDEQWDRYATVHASHGRILATFETLRQDADAAGMPPIAWTAALIERMLTAFDFGTPEHARLHNLAADAIRHGLTYIDPTDAAATAHIIWAGDITNRDEDA